MNARGRRKAAARLRPAPAWASACYAVRMERFFHFYILKNKISKIYIE
jgi:hypothetical protein